MGISLRVQAVGVLAAVVLGVMSGLGAQAESPAGSGAQKAAGTQKAATQAGGRVESPGEVKGKFLQRLGKLQNFSVTFTRDDIFPAMKKEDHWECEARFKTGTLFNQDVRVKAEKPDAVGYAPVDRLEKWIWVPAKKRPTDGSWPEQADVLTPAGGGAVEAVTGLAAGTLERQGVDLFEVLGTVWQYNLHAITPADLSRTATKRMGEVQTAWARVDDDHVTITATDPGSQWMRLTLTLDRRFGYAVVEARQDWEKSKDYSLLKAEQFEEVGGVMMPMTITTLHRGQDCHSDYDAVRNTYHVKAWTMNDPKNTLEAMKPKIPPGVKAEDRKTWEEKLWAKRSGK